MTETSATKAVGGIAIPDADKRLEAASGLTRGGLAGYYERVGEWLLPHLVRRPLTLVRCPDGVGDSCFYQRHPPRGAPHALKSVRLRAGGGDHGDCLYIETLDGLIALAHLAAIELHPWAARIDAIDRPDWIVFDLDPGRGVGFPAVKAAARDLHRRLDDRRLESFVKATGGKGLHVVVPLDHHCGWREAKAFSADLAQAMARARPDRYVVSPRRAERAGRIYIDIQRNDPGASAVAPYSLRAKTGLPAACPLRWDELDRLGSAADYDVGSLPRRLAQLRRDPWSGFFDSRRPLTKSPRSG